MRRLAAIFVLASALVFSSSALAESVFVITGRGWGHSIGMSQWGAYGFAQNGSTYRQILGHYYTGTTVQGGYGRSVGVLLASGRSSLTVGSAAAHQVMSNGRLYTLPAGSQRIGPALIVTDVNGKRRDLTSPITVSGTSPLKLGAAPYRGTFVIRATSTTLALKNVLSLDAYVKGVVPREMPASWHLEALKAQAVAARSYALATGGHCSFGGSPVFCATISDQVYGGISAEHPRANQAVDATAGEAAVHNGSVAATYFFSTSGGKTANVRDEWGSTVPYLVSVDDPYDRISPHHTWGPRDAERDCPNTVRDCVYTASQLRARLGALVPSGVRDITVARNASSRVETVTARNGSAVTSFSGARLRSNLGLRSTWFSIGVLDLRAGRGTITHGQQVGLSGLARGVGTTYLERKPYGASSWTRVRQVTPGANGGWTTTVQPSITTFYRVASPVAAGIARRVWVAARVNFFAPTNRTQLRGVVGPKRAGATVAIQRRQADGSWRTVTSATTNAAGEFVANLALRSGAYRGVARVGAGYLAGTSPVLHIT